MERKRNLNPDEIYDQVVLIDKQAAKTMASPYQTLFTWAWVSLCLTTPT
jgi:23S rRNA (adenine2503-C2)-methyltransferase